MQSILTRAIPAIVAVLGAFVVAQWVTIAPQYASLTQRLPGADGATTQATVVPTDLRGSFTLGQASPVDPADMPGAWPRFRGANFDAISTEDVPLTRQFGSGGPVKLWSIELGEGYAAAAVLRGRVYVLDYDHEARADVLRCIALHDGKDIWRRSYSVDITRHHGISRTVPAVNEQYVLTLGPKCHVVCVDAVSGDYRWGIDLAAQYRTKVPLWYAGQCPLIDGQLAIIAPGGDALMIAVDCATGQVVWQTPNRRRWQMTHSSIMPMTFKGRRMYVYPASRGVVGVSADDGSILWECPDWKVATNVPAPLPLGDDRIFLSGYGAGSMMLQLIEDQGKIIAKAAFKRPPDVFGAEQQTPIFYKDHIYGVIPGGQLVCLDRDARQLWASGGNYRFGLGPFIIADGLMILMNDKGVLTLAEASESAFKPLAQAGIFERGRDSWGPLALAGGRLLARDFTRMVCLDLRKASYE